MSSFHEDFEDVEIEVRITTHLAFHTSVLPPIRCRLVRHLAKQWYLSTHCTRMVMNLLPNMISFALPGGLNPQLSCFRSFGGESDNFL